MSPALQSFIELYENLSLDSLGKLSQVYSADVEFVDPITRCTGLSSLTQYLTKSMQDIAQCHFAIDPPIVASPTSDQVDVAVTWIMRAETQNGKLLTLNGSSHLRIADERICYHRDYYDLGQLIYEHVPLLGAVVRAIKRRLG